MATLEQIQARVKKLQDQAESMIARRAQGALDQIRDLMLKHGLTTEDIERRAKAKRERARAERLGQTNGKAKSVSTSKGVLPPKYRDPKTGATWSGHARPPQWIKNVKDRTKFLIDAASASLEPAVTVKAKVTVKKAVAKKSTAVKSVGKKTAAKKVAAKKAVAKKAVAKKAVARKAAAKKAVAKKAVAKSPVAKKVLAKKVTAKKAVAKKAPAKSAAAPVVSAPVAAEAAVVNSSEA